MRFQQMSLPKGRLRRTSDDSFLRKIFYSIRSIAIGGQCICNGHATACNNPSHLHKYVRECECEHNTCGTNCERCCPLFNQRAWKAGTTFDAAQCERCQCFGHAESCIYDEQVERDQMSIDMSGQYSGGGVCVNCTKHTTGVNCEKCEAGWYRPKGVSAYALEPCFPCACYERGSTGICVSSQNEISQGKVPGDCQCLAGYAGAKCDRCAHGYHNFPNCERCPCDVRGVKTLENCDKQCVCKDNVMGPKCDECKPGFYSLNEFDPRGCQPCYCSSVSSVCEEASNYYRIIITGLEGWLISDMIGSRIAVPAIDSDTSFLLVSNYEVSDVESYYWMAPQSFLANKLTSYASFLKFSVRWIVMRGDTSGKPLTIPDVILIGENNVRIGFGREENYSEANGATIEVPLSEHGWYQIASNVRDISSYMSPNEYRGKAVTRFQYLSVLSNIRHLLLRAKFHTDQVEGSLYYVEMGSAEKSTNFHNSSDYVTRLEKCFCPFGYAGLSCERCDYGFVAIRGDYQNEEEHMVCSKCDCNGHSPSCYTDGKCLKCEHNTEGAKCERCKDGFYGNAENGTQDDCQPCACPLQDYQLTTSCIKNDDTNGGYVCQNCPEGHEGVHCESCAAGYYGDPLSRVKCLPCDCNESPCNIITGECISCQGNTTGPHCDICSPGYYGNAKLKQCRSCDCYEEGSIDSKSCDQDTGKCFCKPNFTGRTCDICVIGYGNASAGCLACSCFELGSTSPICNTITGLCSCKVGVTGNFCDQCLPNHYGLLEGNGCLRCSCDVIGSTEEECDSITGQCDCRPNVIGDKCDTCAEGYYRISSSGCEECGCDAIGSSKKWCDADTGYCQCKAGVTGQKCDRCLPGYYGFSRFGCFKCEECKKPGHICDPISGQCVCPKWTEGLHCDRCASNAWNYEANIGCQLCNCDLRGSVNSQCDSKRGCCQCRVGYAGIKCDTCATGYYGWPKCRPCDCDVAGSDPQSCLDDSCQCDPFGQCYCKENVVGRKCDRCKEGTFGLRRENVAGCTTCFCFGRASTCSGSSSSWGHLRMGFARTLRINYLNDKRVNLDSASDQNYCQNMVNDNQSIHVTPTPSINRANLEVIPEESGSIQLETNSSFSVPLYWRLPNYFLGDKVLAYGGFLKFRTEEYGCENLLPASILKNYPLLEISGGGKFILQYYPILVPSNNYHQIRFHESLWKIKGSAEREVTREVLMMTLQNLRYILVKATNSMDFTYARLSNVSLDVAQWMNASKYAESTSTQLVELCDCPAEYTASSCQDPNVGFYRSYNSSKVHSTVIIEMIGEAQPCNCNGRSSECDPETGYCINCSDNTGGIYCERCADGLYNRSGICVGCPCPTSNKNFSLSCVVDEQSTICVCKPGYTGKLCERCEYGWYGYPGTMNGTCSPCKCNVYGSVSDECDEETGQCNCRSGIVGRTCSHCYAPRTVLTPNGCKRCEDKCVILLLDDLDDITGKMRNTRFDLSLFKKTPPWAKLNKMHAEYTNLTEHLSELQSLKKRFLNTFESVNGELRKKAKSLFNKINKVLRQTSSLELDASSAQEQSRILSNILTILDSEIYDAISKLETYNADERISTINPLVMLKEARYLLVNIKDYDQDTLFDRVRQISSYCSRVKMEIMGKLNEAGSGLELVFKRVEKLSERIEHMDHSIETANNNILQSEDILAVNNGEYEKLKILLQELESSKLIARDLFTNCEGKLNSSNYFYTKIEDNFIKLHSVSDVVGNLSVLMEKNEEISNSEYLQEYIESARIHVKMLIQRVKQYSNIFAEIKQDADLAVRASQAYYKIVRAVDDARLLAESAKNTIDNATNVIQSGDESLLENVKLVGETSRALIINSELSEAKVRMLWLQLEFQKNSTQSLRSSLERISEDNYNIARQAEEMKSMKIDLKDAISDAEKLNALVDENFDKVFSIHDTISDQLHVKLARVQNDTEVKLYRADQKIDEARDNTRKLMAIAEKKRVDLDNNMRVFDAWNSTISDRLAEIRKRIIQARHAADGIKISVTNNASASQNGNLRCSRAYQPKGLQASAVVSITLTYAISSHHRDTSLFYLPSSSTVDFVAVEMVNRKIRFAWNMGGGVGEITHPLHIQTAGDLNNPQHWYRIRAERLLNIGKLSVRPAIVPNGSPLASGTPITNASAWTNGRFDISETDLMWVGGAEGTSPSVPVLRAKHDGLVGCLHQLWLNEAPVPLWNFHSQRNKYGCSACVEGSVEAQPDGSYAFDGEGYSDVASELFSTEDENLFSFSVRLRTFDNDAIIFLATDGERHILVALRGGHVIFNVVYGARCALEIQAARRYNTGKWFHVEVTRYFDPDKALERGILKVNGEVFEGSPMPPPNVDELPFKLTPKYFIGGVPPWLEIRVEPSVSYLGCMRDILIGQIACNPILGTYWGIQPSCEHKILTTVGATGNGYLELTSHSLVKKSFLSLTFATTQANAFLLLSTTNGLIRSSEIDDEDDQVNSIDDQDNRNNYYSMVLQDGRIVTRLDGGYGESVLKSESSSYSDGSYHTVELTKEGRKLELRVDDATQATSTLPEQTSVIHAAGDTGGLFLAGLPSDISEIVKMDIVPFAGTLKDLVFNDKLIKFDESTIAFENVTLGRIGPSPSQRNKRPERNDIIINNGNVPTSGQCYKIQNYYFDQYALKFGDSRYSHVRVETHKSVSWSTNFSVEFSFRTFYANGLLYAMAGTPGKQTHYFACSLVDGKLVVMVKGKRRLVAKGEELLNDGVWHAVKIDKTGKWLRIILDGEVIQRTSSIPKKLNIQNTAYVGGIPQNVNLPRTLTNKFETFKGCIKELIVDGRKEDMLDSSAFRHKVGQCFPNIERGAYFPGDAYAIYKNNFYVGDLLEFELELRTTERNGVLLSVAEPDGYPAISLELNRGAVVMSGDMGDRRPFRVEQKLTTEYIICDGKWHKIEARYANEELTLRIDNLKPQRYWLSDNGHMTRASTDSPLYVAGVPDNASIGTLNTGEYFRGCIRNLAIGGDRRDWTEMPLVHNVLFGSCPVF